MVDLTWFSGIPPISWLHFDQRFFEIFLSNVANCNFFWILLFGSLVIWAWNLRNCFSTNFSIGTVLVSWMCELNVWTPMNARTTEIVKLGTIFSSNFVRWTRDEYAMVFLQKVLDECDNNSFEAMPTSWCENHITFKDAPKNHNSNDTDLDKLASFQPNADDSNSTTSSAQTTTTQASTTTTAASGGFSHNCAAGEDSACPSGSDACWVDFWCVCYQYCDDKDRKWDF